MPEKSFEIYSETNVAGKVIIEMGELYLASFKKEKESGKIVAFELFDHNKSENFPAYLYQIKSQSKILNCKYDEIEVILNHPKAALVPDEFYSLENGKDVFAILFGDDIHTSVKQLTAHNTHIIYGIESDVETQWQQVFPEISFKHKYFELFENWFRKKEELANEYVQVLLYQNHFIVVAAKEKTLLLLNTFSYQTPEDVLYHLLNICERLELNKEEVHFSFAGLIDVESSLFKTLESYLRNIFFIIPSPEILAAKGFQNHPAHYFSSFFNIFP